MAKEDINQTTGIRGIPVTKGCNLGTAYVTPNGFCTTSEIESRRGDIIPDPGLANGKITSRLLLGKEFDCDKTTCIWHEDHSTTSTEGY